MCFESASLLWAAHPLAESQDQCPSGVTGVQGGRWEEPGDLKRERETGRETKPPSWPPTRSSPVDLAACLSYQSLDNLDGLFPLSLVLFNKAKTIDSSLCYNSLSMCLLENKRRYNFFRGINIFPCIRTALLQVWIVKGEKGKFIAL